MNMLKLAVGSALFVTATQVVAVSLGATQGSVIIGRPLDILVQSRIDASDAATGLCLQAEVIYGDVRVPPTAVSAAIHRIGADGTGALRVQTSERVNEPIVTLVLQAGCQTPFRRSYTLLADVEPPRTTAPAPGPTLGQPSSPVVASVTAPVTPSAAPLVLPPPARAVMPPAPATPRTTDAVDLGPQTPIRLSAPAPRPAAVTRMLSKTRPLPVATAAAAAEDSSRPANDAAAPVTEAPMGGSRLQLDPVELPSVANPLSPATPGADGGGGTVAGQGDVSAAADDAAAEHTRALQQEVEALRAEQERLRLALESVNAQLYAAQQASSSPTLVYGLGGLSLLLLGGLWYALRMRRQAAAAAAPTAPWWESSLPANPLPASEPAAVLSPAPGAQTGDRTVAAAVAAPVQPEVAVEPAPKPTPHTAQPSWLPTGSVDGLEVSDARESMFHEVPVTPLNVEALEDLWQRARFCESIGQYAEAMALLNEFVTEHPRASEAPYVLWLVLAATHGTESDQALVQRFYESHYQRLAPAVHDVAAPRHLDDDAALMPAIVRVWPTTAALDLVCQALASQPAAPEGLMRVRTLAAFDDLLMLKGVLDLQDDCTHTPWQPEPMDPSGWKSVNDLAPRSAAGMAGAAAAAPMLDFEFPAVPEPAAAPVAAPSAAPSPAADDYMLDFDLSDWELAPKVAPPSSDEGGKPQT